ncbi:hypothetical protein CRE_09942 [Caenorhabditis remanei]|uniref:F-box domain-containing protein n=1 Tax=Caenorhabditis remanei TaxID=31234 RepID=E3NUK2_CAERE|nr:hypothetical protein CRE_09942 [Caenorhabditis remanei]
MTTTFPVLRLPYPVLMLVLEQMELLERISLSILSKQARMYVKLLKMKINYIDSKLRYDTIEMEVFLDNRETFELELYTSGYVELRYREDIFLCNTMGVHPMDYAVSIMDVLHCKSIYFFRIAEISPCDVLPLLVNLPKIERVVVPSDLSAFSLVDPRLLKALRIVLPVASTVTVPHFFLLKYHREILQRNFDAVKVRDNWVEDDVLNRKVKFSLNNLKMTNAKTLELYNVLIDFKDLNRYFKLWMKKKSNPRLEYLKVWRNGSVNKDLLLKGLNAVPVPIETKREFRILGHVEQLRSSDEETSAEFDITREDDRRATIISNRDNSIHFYVWPESDNDTTNIEPNQSLFMRLFSWVSTFYNSCIDRFK